MPALRGSFQPLFWLAKPRAIQTATKGPHAQPRGTFPTKGKQSQACLTQMGVRVTSYLTFSVSGMQLLWQSCTSPALFVLCKSSSGLRHIQLLWYQAGTLRGRNKEKQRCPIRESRLPANSSVPALRTAPTRLRRARLPSPGRAPHLGKRRSRSLRSRRGAAPSHRQVAARPEPHRAYRRGDWSADRPLPTRPARGSAPITAGCEAE